MLSEENSLRAPIEVAIEFSLELPSLSPPRPSNSFRTPLELPLPSSSSGEPHRVLPRAPLERESPSATETESP